MSPVFGSGEYTKRQMMASDVAAMACGRKTTALMNDSYLTRVAMTAITRPSSTHSET